ncbi:hypothetical protein GCM10009767_02600 [Kocuria aegyptia]|uniref:Uncharacterized protein n=1 Tax=Kocuria aegyptia TaxID=330943 RepID=A0ABP4W7T2_9MICC
MARPSNMPKRESTTAAVRSPSSAASAIVVVFSRMARFSQVAWTARKSRAWPAAAGVVQPPCVRVATGTTFASGSNGCGIILGAFDGSGTRTGVRLPAVMP